MPATFTTRCKSLLRRGKTLGMGRRGVDFVFSTDFPLSILSRYGHPASQRLGKPVDSDGQPIPWFTYPAIQFLDQLDLSRKAVFEWGSGNSSRYFAPRCASISSVESSPDWHAGLEKDLQPNQRLALKTGDDYVNHILETDTHYDVVVIDGDLRVRCAEVATQRLNPDGLVIVDNADWFAPACEKLRNAGLIQVDFHGFGPVNEYTWCTSLFFTRGYSFSPLADRQPSASIGGLEKNPDDVQGQQDDPTPCAAKRRQTLFFPGGRGRAAREAVRP